MWDSVVPGCGVLHNVFRSMLPKAFSKSIKFTNSGEFHSSDRLIIDTPSLDVTLIIGDLTAQISSSPQGLEHVIRTHIQSAQQSV